MLYDRQFIDISQVSETIGSVIGDGTDKTDKYRSVVNSDFCGLFLHPYRHTDRSSILSVATHQNGAT